MQRWNQDQVLKGAREAGWKGTMGGLISYNSRRFFPKLVLCLGLAVVTLGLGVRSTQATGGGCSLRRNGDQRG